MVQHPARILGSHRQEGAVLERSRVTIQDITPSRWARGCHRPPPSALAQLAWKTVWRLWLGQSTDHHQSLLLSLALPALSGWSLPH